MRPRKEDMVMIRVSRREKVRWAAVAADAELTISELVRLAVRDHIALRWPRLKEEEPQ